MMWVLFAVMCVCAVLGGAGMCAMGRDFAKSLRRRDREDCAFHVFMFLLMGACESILLFLMVMFFLEI